MTEELTKQNGEMWKAYNQNYLLSSEGRWYSLISMKFLPQRTNTSGYYRAELYINGKRKHIFTHIAVVELFWDKHGNKIPKDVISLIKLGLSIDHYNKNKFDNYRNNLEIVTHQENCLRRSRKGGRNDQKKKTFKLE